MAQNFCPETCFAVRNALEERTLACRNGHSSVRLKNARVKNALKHAFVYFETQEPPAFWTAS